MSDINVTSLIYRNFSFVLDGCNHLFDAYYFGHKYIEKYPAYREFINGLIKSKVYKNTIDIKTFQEIIGDLCDASDKASCYLIINKIDDSRIDEIQQKTIQRIIKSKPDRIVNILQSQQTNTRIKQKCPHPDCNNIVSQSENEYIICGYTDTIKGYDNEGCGRDWCFSCHKILCKSWLADKLFVNNNRFHTDTCCKNHASVHNKIYPDDYCICPQHRTQEVDSFDDVNDINTLIQSFTRV